MLLKAQVCSQPLSTGNSVPTIQGKYDEAKPLYERALAISEKTLGPDHPDIAIRLNSLASLLYTQVSSRALSTSDSVITTQDKYDEAERLYERSFEIRKRTLGAEHRDVAESLNSRVTLLRSQVSSRALSHKLQRPNYTG